MKDKFQFLKFKLGKSFLIRNILVLMGGTAMAQVIAISFMPFLTRIYSPDDFGIFGTIMAVVGIVSLIAPLSFETALVIENDDNDAKHLLNLILISVSSTTLLFAIATSVVVYFFPGSFGLNDNAILLAVPLVIVFSLYNVCISIHNRNQLYKDMASAQILRKTGIGFFQLAISVFFVSEFGLLLGALLGVLMPILYLLYKNPKFFVFNFSSYDDLKKLSIRYIKFPKFSTPQNLLNLVSGHAPIFAFGYYYNIATAGAFYFALKIVQIPASFIGLSVRQIFLKESAKIGEDKLGILKLLTKFSIGLTIVMTIPMLVIFLYGPDLFSFVFGQPWRVAGSMSSFMVLWITSNIIAAPSRTLFLSQNMQDKILVLDLILFVAKVLVLFFMPLEYSAVSTIAVFSLIVVCVNLGCIFYWVYKLRV